MRTVIMEDIVVDGENIKRGTIIRNNDKRLPKIRECIYGADNVVVEDNTVRTQVKTLEVS